MELVYNKEKLFLVVHLFLFCIRNFLSARHQYWKSIAKDKNSKTNYKNRDRYKSASASNCRSGY